MRRAVSFIGVALVTTIGTLAVLSLIGVFSEHDEQSTSPLPALPGVQAQDGDLGQRVNDIYRRSRGAVVFIQATVAGEGTSPFGPQPRAGMATGSGFLYDDRGHVVTNAHVVENARQVAIQAGESRLIDGELVGADLSTDLAVLRIDPDALGGGALPVGASNKPKVGDPVVAMGNPLGLEDSVTTGIVSALQREIRAPNGFSIRGAIQSDAAINPGNSGGPLLDFNGRVIGVNSQIATAGSRGFIGIGFAVPSATVKDVVPELIRTGKVRRPFLGVTTVTVTESLAKQLRLGTDSGALVTGVAQGSPADRAGIRASAGPPFGAITGGGDVIVAIEQDPVESSDQLAKRISRAQVGERLRLEVVRNGDRLRLTVRIGERN